MKNFIFAALSLMAVFGFAIAAHAANALTADQLLKATQTSLADSAANDPDMAKSISGFKTVTFGVNAQVIISMTADGMNMTTKYLCIPQNADMECHVQQ